MDFITGIIVGVSLIAAAVAVDRWAKLHIDRAAIWYAVGAWARANGDAAVHRIDQRARYRREFPRQKVERIA